MECGFDIFLEHAFGLGRDRRTHQVQRVDGEKPIAGVGLDAEPLDEALGLQGMELALVLDAGERFGRRLVVGGLEDAAEEDRDILNFTPVGFSILGIASWLRKALGVPKSNRNCGLVVTAVSRMSFAAYWRKAVSASTVL